MLDFDDELYGQRWQTETVMFMFMLKSRQGESLIGRSDQSRRNEYEPYGACLQHHDLLDVSFSTEQAVKAFGAG